MAETHSSILDKQVRKAFSLKHSMFATDQILFNMPLAEYLDTSKESKVLWLESVKIAVHDFTIIHECTPCQCTITDFFTLTQSEETTNTTTDTTQVRTPVADDLDYTPALI
eukprot:7321440-Ditylum_brightwellii.AAC.1